MASLQAKHSRLCALGRPWTTFDQALVGCTCPAGPAYYVVIRQGDNAHKEVVGRDRQQAELALLRLEDSVEEGDYRPRPNAGFSDWADRWLESLERKPSTVDSYRSTIVHAKGVFGGQRIRRIGPADIARFNMMLRERGCSPSTRAKHLRVLGACLQAAVFYRYAETNPVRELPPAQRPRPERKEAAYFENDELPRLFSHLRDQPYRSLCLIALKTGMRQGELFALRWCDVDLEEAVVRVRRSRTSGTLGTPKNRERRDVDLISDVVAEFARLQGELGNPNGDSLVFPSANRVGFLTPSVVLRRYLYPAMARADIPRVGPTQEKRNVPQFPAHVRQARVGERRSDHVAFSASRPFHAEGDD